LAGRFVATRPHAMEYHDDSAIDKYFTDDATVRDENKTFEERP
jgi:hypothetical protein